MSRSRQGEQECDKAIGRWMVVMTQKMSWCVEWVVGEKFRTRKAREGNAPDEGPFYSVAMMSSAHGTWRSESSRCWANEEKDRHFKWDGTEQKRGRCHSRQGAGLSSAEGHGQAHVTQTVSTASCGRRLSNPLRKDEKTKATVVFGHRLSHLGEPQVLSDPQEAVAALVVPDRAVFWSLSQINEMKKRRPDNSVFFAFHLAVPLTAVVGLNK